MYATGYNGTVRTKAELLAWSQWQNADDEFRHRVLAIIDASIIAGRPLGIGSIFRSDDDADRLFLSRHHQVAFGGCCTFRKDGKRYALNAGQAHAAQGGQTYHGPTTKLGKAVAVDFIGDLTFLKANAARYGLVEFSQVNSEPWHGQPKELPNSKTRYVQATMDPLKPFLLPGDPVPAPLRVIAPAATQKQRTKADLLLGRKNDPLQVKALQYACNFWGWRDALNRTLIVDGDFGSKSAQAVMAMQRALRQTVDGQYGPMTASAFQRHLDAMAAYAAGRG